MKITKINGEVIFSDDSINIYNCVKNAISKKVDLRGCNLRGGYLRGIDLRDCDLSGSILAGSDLRGCDLVRSNMQRCDISRSNLSGSDLRDCDLELCDLGLCDLSGSNLSGSNLRYSILAGSDLRGCNLDFSTIELSCGSLGVANTDRRLTVQLLYHLIDFASHSGDMEIIKKICQNKQLIDLANQFHRVKTGDIKKLKNK